MRHLIVLIAVCLVAAPSYSATKKFATRAVSKSTVSKPAGPVQTAHRRSPYVGAISVDAATGRVLFEDNADAEAYPASVTKLMTLLLVMEDVKANRYRLDDQVIATSEVNYSEASWVGIKAGETMSVRDLCMALMIESANDAAIALGVKSAGSYVAFVERMNARAQQLGMSRTRYYNPNGLPPVSSKGRRYPWKSFNVSSARDQVKLALALVAIPEVIEFTSVKTCDLVRTASGYRISVTRRTNSPVLTTTLAAGESVIKAMKNHNNIMRTDKLKLIGPDGREEVDGLKTGYIDAGGSSIVLTGSRRGKRAVVVVLGSSTSKERDERARTLIGDALGALTW